MYFDYRVLILNIYYVGFDSGNFRKIRDRLLKKLQGLAEQHHGVY